MKILFMGTPEFAVPILKALNEKYEIALVVSQPNRAKKKGALIDTPVAACAHELGLNLFQPEKIKDNIDEILSYNADVLVTAAYGQYLPSKLLKGFKSCINVHGSLLPKHRGGAPIQRAILEGDKVTGITIMQMAKKLDAGCIYAQREYEIKDTDNSSTVFEALSLIGRDLLLETIEDIYSGKNQGVEQVEEESTYSANLLPEEEKISLEDTTDNILNRIRAFAMEIGAYLEVNGVKLKIFSANRVEYNGEEKPGTVLQVKKGIKLKTLDGAIELGLVLYPGKKMMSGKDFSNGQKIFILGEVIDTK